MVAGTSVSAARSRGRSSGPWSSRRVRSSAFISPHSMRDVRDARGGAPTRLSISRLMSARSGQPPIVSLTLDGDDAVGRRPSTRWHHAERHDVGAELGVDDRRRARPSPRLGGAVACAMADDFTGRVRVISWCGRSVADSSSVADAAQLDLLKALGDNTRYAIYLELARSPRPLTTADIAESLGAPPEHGAPAPRADARRRAARRRGRARRGEVGRPQHRYSVARRRAVARPRATDDADAGAHGAAHGAAPRRQRRRRRRASARRGGAARRRLPTAPSTLEALVSDLDRLGFDPIVTDGPATTTPRSWPSPTVRSRDLAARAPRTRVRPAPRARRRLRRARWATPRSASSARSRAARRVASRLGSPD